MEQAPEHFEVLEGRGFYRPVAQVALERAVEMVTVVLVHARVHGIKELFINGHGLTGFDTPTLSERFFLAEKWAAAAGGAVRAALAVHAHMIDPERFGMTVANNRGLVSDVFDNEADAIAWLDRFKSKSASRPPAATGPSSHRSMRDD